MAEYSVDVLTPSRVLFRDKLVEQLFVPTSKGEMNILPEHTHLIATIDLGSLKVVVKGKKEQFFIEDGICKILHDKVVILVKDAINPIELDKKELEQQLEQKKQLLKESSMSVEEFEGLLGDVRSIDAKLALISNKEF